MLKFLSTLDGQIAKIEEAKKAFADAIQPGVKVKWTHGMALRAGTVVDVGVDDKTGAIVYMIEPDRLRDRPDLADKPPAAIKVYPYQNVVEA